MVQTKEVKSYWNGEAQCYSSGIKAELNTFRKDAWKKIIMENGKLSKDFKILDAGCGPGFFPIILGEEGYDVTAIDLSTEMVKCAKENLEIYGLDSEVLAMDCQETEFDDESFDVIISRNITWTLDNPEKAYREWYRLLKKGGTLLVFDASWCLYMFDKELEKKYMENQEYIVEKYGRKIHNHVDQEKGDQLSRELFMSDKIRPKWDLDMMKEIGFSEVFADEKIYELIWDEQEKEMHKFTPQFLVGGRK